MAQFDTNGLDALILDMEEIEEIDDDTMLEMLTAGGEVIREAHVEEIQSTFDTKTGKLMGSPKVFPKFKGGSRYVLVYPEGAHHTYRARVSSYVKMNWGRAGQLKSKGGGNQTATNSEVGFVQEFGGHGNDATQWMRKANEKHADEAVDAEYSVFDAWHRKHNL